jgi:hypothetical protein
MIALMSGTYTIVGNLGGHRTVRISDDTDWMTTPPPAGTRIIAAMTGSDNERSFTGIGFLTADGTVSIWHKQAWRADFVAAARWLVKNGIGREVELGRAYAFMAVKCFLCNRKLTTEHAKFHGYGADCAEIHGLPYDRKARLAPGHPLHKDAAEVAA